MIRVGKHLQHILKTKGAIHGLERSVQVLYRFARGRRKFDHMIERLESDLPGTRITFCLAASLLAKHQDAFERLHQAGHELAAHGLYHSRMDYLDYDGQVRILEESRQEFDKAGIEVAGFRCPYLNFNDDTIDALQSSPYSWTSQEIVFWQNGHNPGTERLKALYHTRQADEKISVPFRRGRILEIPITAPDDEMLVERLRIREAGQMERIWQETFLQIYELGELCHLLFHPERYFEVASSLGSVVALAKDPGRSVWAATIGEVCDWWKERQKVSWTREPAGSDGTTRIRVQMPGQALMLLKDPSGAAGDGFYRDYMKVDPVCRRENGVRHFELNGLEEPVVWVSPECPDWLEAFLVSEGFLVTRSAQAGPQAIKIGPETLGSETNRRAILEKIEACPRPLLRVWRWPDGARAALTISSDVDSITLADLWRRLIHF